MSRNLKTLRDAHFPYWFQKLSLRFSCSIIILSTALSPLASFASAAESNFQANQNNAPFIESSIPFNSSISPLADTTTSFNLPPTPGPTSTPAPTSIPDTTDISDTQSDINDTNQLNLVESVFAEQKIKASLEPAIFIEDKPFTLNWSLPDWYLLEPGETRHMIITLPESLDISSKLIEKEISVPVISSSGSATFNLPTTVVQTLEDVVIGLELYENDKSVGRTSIIVGVPAATFDKTKASSLRAFNDKVKVSLPAFSTTSNLAVDIRHPDENSLPSLSLTGKPVEILAVNTETAKNVTRFEKPVTIEFVYADDEIWDWQEDELKIFYFDEDMGDWRPLPTTVDPNTNTLTAQTDHFTVFDYKAETWQAASLPTIDSFQVSEFIGAGTYSMPFWTPPGPGGLQPSLSLSYNSQMIDNSSLYTQASWVGAGWSLDTGSIIRIMHDTDDDTSDDTFTIAVAGIGSTLLPVNESGTVTTYRTADESYNKIEYDSSTESWTVTTTTGTVYEFEDIAETHTTDGCAATSGDLNIIWRWSLSTVTDIHGNELVYSYYTETKSGCANEVAVYPEYITYPHDRYRVHFVREDRDDYKSAWEDSDSEVLYGTERLKEVRIEHDPNGTSSWNTIRKYEFTYSDNTINQIYPAFTWSEGGKTLTLIEVQEISGDGTDSLPATSFYYEDDIHLTKVENGLGGNITLEYERWTYHDDVNDDLRSMLIIFGGNECTSTLGTSWVAGPPNYGRVSCSPGYLEIGHDNDPGTGLHSIPEHIAHPGGLYHFYLRLCGDDDTTDGKWGFIKQDTSPYSFTYASFDDVGNNYQQVDLQETFEIPIDYDPSDTKLRIDCSDCRIYKMQFTLRPVYFRVISKTIKDQVTGRESTYTYQYDNPSPNDEYRSEAVAEAGQNIEDLYSYPMREYRGNQMTQVVDEKHLAQTTWYYQNDYFKGSPYKTFTFRQDFWDAFDSLDTSDWTTSTAGTHEIDSTYSVDYDNHLRMTNTVNDWSVSVRRSSYSLTNGDLALGHFRLGSGSKQAQIRLAGNTGDFFGFNIIEDNGELKVRTRYDNGEGAENGSTIIALGDYKPDKWYGFMFFVDTDKGSGVRIWQLDDPTNAGEEKIEGLSSYSWRFRAYVIDGVLDIDAYQEGKPYSETNLVYDYEILYDTVPDNGIDDLSDSNLLDYIDLKVVSTEVTETSTRVYEGDYSWTGTETSYTYDVHGNVTEIIEAGKDAIQSDYVEYRKTVNEYAINTTTAYLVSLPARTRQYECLSGSCTSTNLATSTRYLYDDAISYSTTPTTGILTGTRVLAESLDFVDQEFDYDTYGNLTAFTQYKALENYSGFGLGTSISTATIYDSTYHTYPVTVTNPLSQSTTTVYDYTLGLPTSVTDPNSAVTTGEYDDFGRIASVCYPGENCTSTPNLQFVYYDSYYPFYTEVIQKINSSQNFRIRKYYSGLGELLQTQILGADVNGISRDIITNNLYDEFGNLIRQSVPYDVPLGSGYRTPSWSSYTTFGYDVLNRPISTTAPNGNSTHTYYYDLQVKVTDPRWKSTNSYLDVWGRTIEVDPPTGTDLEDVTYDYDILGQLLELSQDTLTTEITYDQAGRKTGMDDPDMGSWSYEFDALGNLTSQTDARICTTTLAYDDLSRLTGKSYSGSGSCGTTPSVIYTYDQGTNGTGRRTGMSDGSGASSWIYDSRGRVLSETRNIKNEDPEPDTIEFITSWTYNSADMVASITYPDDEVEVVEFEYNNQKAIIGMENTEATPVVYISDVTYDSAGRLTSVDLGESGAQAIIAREFEYFPWGTAQDGGMLQSLTSNQVGGVTLQNLTYDYDPNGNILEITDYVNQEVSSYSYDNLNRLLSAEVEDFSTASIFDEYYEYASAIGNLTGKGSSPTSLADYVYDVSHPHAVAEYGIANDYEYDANGNQIVRQINEDDYNLIYDAENRLISVSSTDIPTPTLTPTPEFTATLSNTPTKTNTPTSSNTPAATFTATAQPTPTPSATPIPVVPAVEASTSWSGGDQSFINPIGTNLLIVGYGIGYSNDRPSTMTYNGESMTLQEETINPGGYDSVAQLWVLENPDTGSSYTISPSNSSGELVAVAISGANIGDLFSQIDEYALDTDDDLNFAKSITSAEGELVIDVFSTYRGSNPVPDTTGQTLIENESRLGVSKKAGASSVTVDWISGTTRSSPSCWIIAALKKQIEIPTPTPTITYTPSITPTPTITFTPSETPTPTQTGTIYPTPTPSNTAVPSPTPTQVSIQFDAASGKGGAQWGSSSLEWTHTSYGYHRIVLVFVRTLSSTTASATYAGQSMTQEIAVNNSYLFSLVGPPPGAQTVLVTLGASSKVAGAAVSYTGVHQTNPISGAVQANGTSVTVSSSTDSLVVGAGSHRTITDQDVNPRLGQTERIEVRDQENPDNDRRVVMGVSDENGAASVVHSYSLYGDIDRTWAVSLNPYAGEFTPTPTITSTPTLTYTPSATPSPTQTGTINPILTPTDSQFEPTPEPLESAQYTYDSNGKMVKSVVNGVTTYYVGKIYELEVDGEVETERKYYSLGGQRFAVRDDGVLNWILSDHLGSSSVSAHANGSWRGEIAYTPFGEMRASRGMTLTDYRYTGQRLEAEVGLYFYQARWMDPVVGRFTQADTLIPDPGNPLSLDRYAYVYSNPVKYTDPSGHYVEEGWGGEPFESEPPTKDITDKIIDYLNPFQFPENELVSAVCNNPLPDCFGNKVYLKDFSAYGENNPISISDFKAFADKVAEDLFSHDLSWPGFLSGRDTYDTPFYNNGGSEARTDNPAGIYSADQIVCIETIGCYGRSDINYIAQGMWGAAVGEPALVTNLIAQKWKSWEYEEDPSGDTYFWLDYGRYYYNDWKQQQ